MKPEAQQIAIAEECGWKMDANGWINPKGQRSEYNEALDVSYRVVPVPPPDYLNDRNAMWDAAEAAGEATIKAMRFWLFQICGEMKAHHATAAQEAEAFLRAKGKLVDE